MAKLEGGEVKNDELEVGFKEDLGKGGLEWNVRRALVVMGGGGKEGEGPSHSEGENATEGEGKTEDHNIEGYRPIEYKPLSNKELESAGMKGPPVAVAGEDDNGKKKKKKGQSR